MGKNPSISRDHVITQKDPEFSIIIVNWNGKDFLSRCLLSVREQTFKDYEIILVDNGSSDGSVELVQSDFPEVTLILLDENQGYASGNNLGAQNANGKWLVLLNNDAYPAMDWLEKLYEATLEYKDSAFFGSCLIQSKRPDLIDGIGDVYHVSGLAWRDGYNQSVSMIPEEPVEIFSPCGAAAAVRKSAFELVGGFDEDYYSYHEDVDLGFRIRLKGLRGYLIPDAVVYHQGSASTGVKSDYMVYYGHRNLVWSYFQNMPGWYFWKNLPLHIIVNLFFLAYFSVKGKSKPIWKAKWDALIGLPRAIRKRRLIQGGRVAHPRDIMQVMEQRWIEPLKNDFLNRNRQMEGDVIND